MLVIREVYRVFDTLYFNEKDASDAIRGWEHKEKITKHFALFHSADTLLEDGLSYALDCSDATLFDTWIDANREAVQRMGG